MDREARRVGGAGPDDAPLGPESGHPVEDADVETSSDGYAARFTGSVGEWFLAVQAAYTLELLEGLPRGARVLDVGGGHAQLTPYLVEAGFDVVVLGSDDRAGQRLGPYLGSGRVRFETGSLVELPYDSESFTATLSFRLLPHLHRWELLIPELCRVARSRVVVDYPSTRSVNVVADRMFGLKKRVEKNTRPYTLVHPRQIRAAFRGAGFQVAGVRAQFLLPMVLHRMVRSATVAGVLEGPGRLLGITRWLGSPVIVRADRAR